jgi:hypothetical protein
MEGSQNPNVLSVESSGPRASVYHEFNGRKCADMRVSCGYFCNVLEGLRRDKVLGSWCVEVANENAGQ